MTATASVCQWVCKMGDTEKNKKEKEPDKTVRVYLDNCAYNRPYDSQTQMKVELETQAKLRIQRLIKEGKIELASSYMSLYECGENPDPDKAEAITDFIETYSVAHAGENRIDEIEDDAMPIMDTGVKFKDACHVAAAIYTGADYFISTDQRLLKYQTNAIKLINPVEFFFNEEEATESADKEEEDDS